MQFKVLGPLEALAEDGARPLRRGRPRELLHLLLLNRRVVLPIEFIADQLWEAEAPLDGVNSVHQLVSYLRRALGEEGRTILATTAAGYRLDVADEDVDAWQFEQLVTSVMRAVSRGGSEGAETALREADEATRLWRGEPFTESSGHSWVGGDVNRLKDSYLQLRESRLEALLILGRHREVALEAQGLVAAYPLREQLHAQLALALYRSGRQSEALDVHRALRATLADELGLDPGAPMQRQEQQILNQDSALDWAPPPGLVDLAESESEAGSEPGVGVLRVGAGAAGETVPEDRTPPPLPPPSAPTPLVGRERDLDTALRTMRLGPVLTITGPPGVGKSRLAGAVCAAAAIDPVWFVDLSDVTADDLVAGTVVSRLNVTGQFPHDPSERLVAALQGVEGILVLDSCEQVVAGVATLVRTLLERAPELVILATSRRPLGVEGELVHRLAPLPLPSREEAGEECAAVSLFADRARRARADFDLDGPTLEQVRGIVTDLDGLPLAIELAAANVDVLSLSAIRERLASELDYLVAPGGHGPARQHSLKAALSASQVLLTSQEATFFSDLAVFPAGFDLPAAAMVAGLPRADAFSLLASLVRQSLVVQDGEHRYRLLRPIREFAAEQLTERDEQQVRLRHAGYVAEVVGAIGPDTHARNQGEALDRLRLLLSDARAALEWCLREGEAETAARIALAYSWYWTLSGLADEGLRWLRAIRDRVEAGHSGVADTRLYAAILRNLGLLANPVGQLTLAAEVCAQSAALSKQIEDWEGSARALLTLGIAQWAQGDLGAAARSHDEAVELASRADAEWARMAGLVLRARTAVDAAEPDTPERIETAILATQVSGDKHMGGLASLVRARWELAQARPELAAIAAEDALSVWRSINYREGEIGALNLLGRVRLGEGDIATAEQLHTGALAVAASAGHVGGQCESVESLATVAASTGRFEQAYLLLSVSLRERERIGAVVPAADQPRISALDEACTVALGEAASLVQARARLLRLDTVVENVLTGSGVGVRPFRVAADESAARLIESPNS